MSVIVTGAVSASVMSDYVLCKVCTFVCLVMLVFLCLYFSVFAHHPDNTVLIFTAKDHPLL